MIYRIKDWDENFENNRTRELKAMTWIPVPNKHDGDGYTALVDHENGAAHLGCWLAILQIASKCGMRGTLLRDGARPHDSRSIARITRLPCSLIEETLERLCSSEIGWMEVVDNNEDATIPHEDAAKPQGSAPISHPSDYGMEGNGIEEKKSAARTRSLKCANPDVERVVAARPEFSTLRKEDIAKILHDYGSSSRFRENLDEFVCDAANSLEPIGNPSAMLRAYLRRSGNRAESKTERRSRIQ